MQDVIFKNEKLYLICFCQIISLITHVNHDNNGQSFLKSTNLMT